ncbi:EamA family transporter RarD [Sphingomonas sp. AX6]|uniref:EamA family transporter RarD n=1 Tax=Sphingomonas sp. AX6 TaxID=2653171 RepID=UPI0012EF67F0|nr:EamA family transporter RarD [Sphingomonas sp. AX6]VXC81017.1 Protein RarD [Sphingomonas sp. AX6]
MQAPATPAASLDRRGLAFGLGAYLIWGFLPLYFLLLAGVTAGEIVADRVVWSLVLLVGILAVTGRFGKLLAVLRDTRTLGLLAVSAALISVNWLIYIWAVQNGHVLAASLGYFLNPLVNVLIGVVVLGERLTRTQMAAVALAAAGVIVLAVGAGAGLWISLTLAVSFAFYGLVRKVAPVESLEGLTIETAILTPFALAYMAWLARSDALIFGDAAGMTGLLVLAGAVTAVPLLLFAGAARLLPYSTLGLLQYLAPTLQFLLAITVFGEVMTLSHIICFALIWSGLALYVFGSVRRPRPTP